MTLVLRSVIVSASIVTIVIAAAFGCGSGGGDADLAALDSGGPGSGPGGPALTDGGGSDGPLVTEAPDGAVCGSGACTGLNGACGTITDACGQQVACEPCRYTSDSLPVGSGGEWVAIAEPKGGGATSAPVVAIGNSSGIQLATKNGSSWQLEHVAPGPDAGTSSLDLFGLAVALAPDGTPWIGYTNLSGGTSVVSVAHRVGSTWTIEQVSVGTSIAVAIASDGTPYAAYAGSVTGSLGGTYGAVLARYAAGSWTRTMVSAGNQVTPVGLAMAGTVPHLAWFDGAGSLMRYGTPTAPGASTFTVEDVDTVSTLGVSIDLSIAVDTAGRPHIAYFPYGSANHAVRDGSWTHASVGGGSGYGNGPVRIAAGPAGAVAFAALSDVDRQIDVGFVQPSPLAWSLTPLVPRCSYSQAHMDMAFDGAGTLSIVDSCGFGSIEVLTQAGIFPTGFSAACDTIIQSLCNEACSVCPHRPDGDCCLGGDCMSPPSYCVTHEKPLYCGSAIVDPNAVFACKDALSQAACTPDGGVGAVAPPACSALHL
jgi:hypothetical protein